MKKTIIIIGIILGLIIINIFSINSYYNNLKGNKLYENKDFSGALDYFEKNKDYIGLYNLGNINYKLGEKNLPLQGGDAGKAEGVIKFWEKSLNFYKNSLKLKYTKNAEFNYNFVKKKLDELKKKLEEKQKKQEKKQQSDSQQGASAPGEKNQENKEKQNSGNENKKSDKKDGEQSGNKKDKNSTPQLSKQAKEQLKAYEEKLRQEQKRNAGNFGKVYREDFDPFDNFNDFFNNDPFFDNSLLNNKEDKKDW